jgi:DNA-binding NtrC family response regulator
VQIQHGMPTSSWGSGKTALLVGAEGGALAQLPAVLETVGFHVVRAPPRARVLEVLEREHVAVVYVDAAATGAALELVGELKQRHPEIPCILVHPRPAATDVADAMRAGAFDFLPADSPGATVLARLHDALDAAHPPPAQPADATGEGGLIGRSAAMRRVSSTIARVARFKTTVLVLGESGVGKELVARALHTGGPRASKPFIPVNCAQLGKELLESELFGHEKGAFAGAHAQKKGLLEHADGGTLFLDEIGAMDLGTQGKLLRFLERSAFRRIGGTQKVKIDVAVVAATNQDLRTAIASGRFRDDLYYRLKVVSIVVPPLRERKEDIPALIEAFIADFNQRTGKKIRGVTTEAMRRLVEHAWPGNVRELKNCIESAAMLADHDWIDDSLFEQALGESGPSSGPSRRAVEDALGSLDEVRVRLPARLADVERELILRTVRTASGRREAAQQLGIGLRTLYAKLRDYGVTPDR